MKLEGKTVGFIGAGAMAEAIIAGLTRSGTLSGTQIFASDLSASRLQHLSERFGIRQAGSNTELIRAVDVVIVAVKPVNIEGVLREAAGALQDKQLVISIVAGYSLADIERLLPPGIPVVRVMPNTPCLVGAGMSVLSLGQAAGSREESLALSLFQATGDAIVLPEKLLEAATGLSGSGPAYLGLVIEALIDAGVRVGIPREIARRLVVQTAAGTAKMLQDTGMHPAVLKDMVTSPGGTTVVGLEVMEAHGVRASLIKAVVAANARAAELVRK